jgi:hypothetical protein
VLPHWFNTLLLKTGLRDELQILIHPHQISIVRVRYRFGNVVFGDRQIIELEPAAQSSSALTEYPDTVAAKSVFQELWRPAISALRSALSAPRWQNAIPSVVLSSHFVRYAIIPWNAELANAAERNAYLRHCFMLAYGEAARQWDLRLSPAGFGQPALASGISTILLDAIHLEMQQAGLPAENIYPSLMLAANETREYLGKEQAGQSLWFVSQEPGRLCLSLVEKGQWRSLKSIAAESDISRQLQALIQRESIMAGIDTTNWPVVIHGSGPGNAEQIFLRGRIVKIVEAATTFTPTSTDTYKLAV